VGKVKHELWADMCAQMCDAHSQHTGPKPISSSGQCTCGECKQELWVEPCVYRCVNPTESTQGPALSPPLDSAPVEVGKQELQVDTVYMDGCTPQPAGL
jgi:hypothetical protein